MCRVAEQQAGGTAYTDEQLTRWREAAIAGGLPEPSRRDRWQVLRAGVVNLWEFDEAEYWYADGWVQLTGRNETGKSSLMALTTLIPWLGDTSTTNIDTLGGSGKQFRYYVEPTTLDGDRRDASASSSRGWLWVEYARIGGSGDPEFFTTLGYAEARRASATLTPRWCTAHGAVRVRRGLSLAEARTVRSPKEVHESLGDEPGRFVLPHGTGAAYRSAVAETLLGAEVERLETVGKMLRVARTPKLGESLNASFVTEKLRDALPGLERSEVEALAEGWDQLDRARRDLVLARENVDVLRQFVNQAWMPYARARLRQGADAAAAARSAFDGVTRRVRESTEALTTAQTEVSRLVTAIADAEVQAESARAQREAHLESRAYLDAQSRAQNLENKIADSKRARSALGVAMEDLDRHETSVADAADERTAAEEKVEAHAIELKRLVAAVLQQTAVAGVRTAKDYAVQRDWTRLGRAVAGRRDALERLEVLDRAYQQGNNAARTAEERAATLRTTAETTVRDAEGAWTAAGSERERLASAVAAWAGVLDAEVRPDGPHIDRWVAALPQESGASNARLADGVRTQWLAPRVEEHARQRQGAELLRDRLEADRDQLIAEVETLRTAPDPVVPQPVMWRRSARVDREGEPFWRLVNPRPGVDADTVARVEAALAGMGVLDAWVTPTGARLTDADVQLTPTSPAATGSSLTDLLDVAETDGPLASVVATALAGIAWRDRAPSDVTSYAIGADGSWTTPLLSGRAEPLHPTAELLGEPARQAARQRRIDALTTQVADLDVSIKGAQNVIDEAVVAEERLRAAFALLPGDGELLLILTSAATLSAAAERQSVKADGAERSASARRTEADAARTAELDYARQFALPVEPAERRTVSGALDEARLGLAHVEGAERLHGVAVELAAAAHGRHEAATTVLKASRATRVKAERALAEAEATESALRAALDDDDEEILVRATRLGEVEKEHSDAAKAYVTERSSAERVLGTAQTKLEQAQADRDLRRDERDASFEEFWRLVDSGLADQAIVELPAVEQRTIEATRDQVAVLRDRVPDPRGWAADPTVQADVVRRALQRLTERLETLRVALEAGGRTTRLDQASDPAQVSVVVEATGTAYAPRQALVRLQAIHDQLDAAYNESLQGTLTELLGSAFIEHLRDRLTELRRLTSRINDVLARHPTGTTRTRLRIHLAPAAGATEAVLSAIEQGDAILDVAVAGRVRDFLRSRIEEARALSESGAGGWQPLLADALDYRRWFAVTLQKKTGDAGHWTPMTSQNYAHLSGGARVVMLMLPFISTLTALYESMPTAPRPFWLDEAFDGLDTTNRATVLGLLGEFDLDVLVVGPGRLLNSPSVPVAAIYQVVRAEDPHPGADLAVELWAAGELTPIELSASGLAVLSGTTTEPSLFSDPEP